MERVYNFSAGPAALPEPVLERAKAEMLTMAQWDVGDGNESQEQCFP